MTAVIFSSSETSEMRPSAGITVPSAAVISSAANNPKLTLV